ncbi:MAG: AAA family ATPase [Chlamydiales bacterium]|nr:AAA family ATPase [Chlamydiales bacterium]
MERLFEIQRIIIEQVEVSPFYWREQFDQFIATEHVCGILGARGIGKTTFLLRYAIQSGAKKREALYVSADNVFFLENSLIDLAHSLYKQTNTRLLLIDEIHKYPNWRHELKNIVDTFPTIRIFFSGSSMIDIVHGKFDLSRRVVLHKLCGLSFREYMQLTHQAILPKLSLDEIFSSHLEFAQELNITGVLKHFGDYLRIGYYPFFKGYSQDRDKFQALDNAVQMTIYEDIATLHSLKTPTLSTIEQLYKYVLNSSPGELNASKLSNALDKDFESVSNYLKYLEQAGLIRFIYPGTSGQAALRNPIKMYPENTNLIHAAYLPLAQDQIKGKIRETFLVNQVQNAEKTLFYSATGDFKIDERIIEVGGKGKTKRQIKYEKNSYVLADDLLVGSKDSIPLYLFGLLY